MSAEIEIELPALPDYVSFVRLVVAAVAELEPSLETSKIDDLRVAVSEAATNAIQAHARAGSKRPISVRCRRVQASMSTPSLRSPRLIRPSGFATSPGWGSP